MSLVYELASYAGVFTGCLTFVLLSVGGDWESGHKV